MLLENLRGNAEFNFLLKLSRTLWGPPGHKSLSRSPISYFQGKGFSLLDLP